MTVLLVLQVLFTLRNMCHLELQVGELCKELGATATRYRVESQIRAFAKHLFCDLLDYMYTYMCTGTAGSGSPNKNKYHSMAECITDIRHTYIIHVCGHICM